MISGNKTLKAMIFGLAVSALAIGGCSNQEKTAWGTVEPDAAALVVYADAGLGASDALGHQLYVEDSDTRFASAAMVYEMAWAEDPTLVRNEKGSDGISEVRCGARVRIGCGHAANGGPARTTPPGAPGKASHSSPIFATTSGPSRR